MLNHGIEVKGIEKKLQTPSVCFFPVLELLVCLSRSAAGCLSPTQSQEVDFHGQFHSALCLCLNSSN